jgi:hypothetical protein
MVVTKKALEYNKVIEYCVSRGISIIDYRKCYHVSYTQHWINLYNHIIKEVVEVNCLNTTQSKQEHRTYWEGFDPSKEASPSGTEHSQENQIHSPHRQR